MTIAKIDLIGLIAILFFAVRGYRKGAIGSLIGLVGLIASFAVAWTQSPGISEKLMSVNLIKSTMLAWLGKINAPQDIMLQITERVFTLIVFIVIIILVNMIFNAFRKFLKKAGKIPILATMDHFIGLAFGILSAVIIMLVVVGVMYYGALYVQNTAIQEFLAGSYLLKLLQFLIH